MNKLRFTPVILLFLAFGLFVSCQEEVDFEPSLLTEEVLYLSGERVRVLGRVITNQNIEASDHGFQISESEQFSQPIVISLGERTGPGRFIGETDGLDAGTRYFVRSFLRTGSGEIYGNVITVESLLPAAVDMVPNNGRTGTVITISGRNFGSDTRVFFGSTQAQVQGIDFESSIRVVVPPGSVSAVVPVRVVSQGREMTLPFPFEYTTGKFTAIGVFPGALRLFDNIALQEGDDFYVGLGNLAQGLSQTLNNRMWKYNLGAGTWQEVPFPGGIHFRGFSTGRYFGGGLLSFGANSSVATFDFWKLENGSFIKLRNLPAAANQSAAFETADAVYVLGGVSGTDKQIYRYSKSTDTWSRIKDAPISINLNVMNFHYRGRQYFIDQGSKGLYEYNPVDETWNVVSTYPGVLTNIKGLGITIGDFAYVGMENRSEQMWELDLKTMNWVRKNDFPGLSQGQNVGVFQNAGNIYILRNGEIQISGAMQFWQFDPRGF
jgi:hypothetical protein